MKALLLWVGLFGSFISATSQTEENRYIQFVLASDVHYGITRKSFRGANEVEAFMVNAAMVKQINTIPSLILPNDNGIRAGKKIGFVDFFAETGDITNKMDPPYQAAAKSWTQFEKDYLNDLSLSDKHQHKTPLFLVPGNHDATNAIGSYKPMEPVKDASSMAGIYNLEFHPPVNKTKDTYRYDTDKINYSRELDGVHFVFMNIWPDSSARIWLAQDLKKVDPATPVVIFAHDPPEPDPKHFTNPNGTHDLNAIDKFENLIPEIFKDDQAATPLKATIEQQGFVSFLKSHPNIKAYFHGHNNWNEYYDYTGPDHDIVLHTFRVDSPMKGRQSATDETKLSFQFAVIDTKTKTMTVRECLWNTDGGNSIQWGSGITVSLK